MHSQQVESDYGFPRPLSQQCKRKEKLKEDVESSKNETVEMRFRRENMRE